MATPVLIPPVDVDISDDALLTPLYCSYSDCYGAHFEYLGVVDGLAWWFCKDCGGDFATDA